MQRSFIRTAVGMGIALGLSIGFLGCPPANNGSLASVRVVNNSGIAIVGVYISAASNPSWGSDWLGSDTIPSGSYADFVNIDPGTYDILVVGSNNKCDVIQQELVAGYRLTYTINVLPYNVDDVTEKSNTDAEVEFGPKTALIADTAAAR